MTGCVATAMAQVMKYWNWPDTGVGQYNYYTYFYGNLGANFGATAYDWANMPDSLSSSSTPAQVSAVATLMYHCGVATETSYGTLSMDGSGAMDLMLGNGLSYPCAENALRTYFKYSPDITGVRRVDLSGEEWAALIKNEIDNRRPVIYSGNGYRYGHEFVCDGYDTNGFFHFNWGYSGAGDGYYTFSNLNPLGGNFTSGQMAIVGITPDTLYGSSSVCTVNVASADPSKGRVSGGGTYNYRDTVILQAVPTMGHRFLRWSNGSVVNPYPVLAHDMNLTAYFGAALAEDGDVLSYTGTNTSSQGVFTVGHSIRIGIKLPASVLAGHKYLSAVDLYHYFGEYVIYVHRGGDDAPGPIIYTQPAQFPYVGNVVWNRFQFESPIPIDTNENLWVTVRFLGDVASYMGRPNLGISDANWVSTDNGNSWQHLNQIPNPSSWIDTSISWFIRCVTTPDSVVDSQLTPTAFLILPKKCNVGDSVMAELLHSPISTVDWTFNNAECVSVCANTALLVWNSVGTQTVEARVEGPGGSTSAIDSILVLDCKTPISTFPYVINFGEDEELKACWQLIHYGSSVGYHNVSNECITVLLLDGMDDRYISPLFDLGGGGTTMLEIVHQTTESCNITVEVSQGGLDSSDFTTIYTLPANSEPGTSQPINLSEHYQGNPLRVAIRLRRVEEQNMPRFELHRLHIWKALGIDDAEGATMTVYPNPARQMLSVTLPHPGGMLSIFDAEGRLVMRRPQASTETSINVSSLPQGVYMLQYTSMQGSTTKRFVVR